MKKLQKKKNIHRISAVKACILQYLNKKNEEVEFYNYMSHLEKYKFEWEDTELAFKYSMELQSDRSKLIKKLWMHKGVRRKFFLYKQRIWNITLTDPNKRLENKFTVR